MLMLTDLEFCEPEVLLTALEEAQRRYQLFPTPADGMPKTVVVVGVSGGADSVCLLHVLLQLTQSLSIAIHVAHLDHNLRSESRQDAEFVANLAASWHLPFLTERLAPDALSDEPGGVEAAARRARYAFLAQTAINVTPPAQVPVIALGHHADDQAETVLLHLVRGSGLRGLGGMAWAREEPLSQLMPDAHAGQAQCPIRLVRPFLGVRKQAILRYMQQHGLSWCEDQSNSSQHFLRNQLRHDVLPRLATINPAIVETVGRLADILAAEQVRLDALDRQQLAAVALTPAPSNPANTCERVILDLAQLLKLDLASQRGVLRQALAMFAPHLHDVEFAQVERMRSVLQPNAAAQGPHPVGQGLAWSIAGATLTQPAQLSLHRIDALPFLPDHPYFDATWQQQHDMLALPSVGMLAVSAGWQIQVTRCTPEQLPADWKARDQPWRVYLDAEQVGTLCLTTLQTLTTSQASLKFAPLGMNGRHKSLGDFFTNHKVPPSLRRGWPLLVDRANQTVLWVGGLAIAHQVRITERTRQILGIQWIKVAAHEVG